MMGWRHDLAEWGTRVLRVIGAVILALLVWTGWIVWRYIEFRRENAALTRELHQAQAENAWLHQALNHSRTLAARSLECEAELAQAPPCTDQQDEGLLDAVLTAHRLRSRVHPAPGALEDVASTSCVYWQLRAHTHPSERYEEWAQMCRDAGYDFQFPELDDP